MEAKENQQGTKKPVSDLYINVYWIGMIAISITCIVLASLAYSELVAVTSDVYDVLDNWQTKPVSDIYTVPYDEDCFGDDKRYNFGNANYPGISIGHCGCAANIYGYTSSLLNCSDEAEYTSECMTEPSQNSFGVEAWRTRAICYRRDGMPAASWGKEYVRRPYPDNDGNCPEGYRKCGNGTYTDGGAICFPETSRCPITGILVASLDNPPLDNSWILVDANFSASFALYERREYVDELPVVDFRTALTSYNDDIVNDDYVATRNSRGPCYIGVSQELSSRYSPSEFTLGDFSISYPSTCRTGDRRFKLFDRADITSIYLDNVMKRKNSCDGFEVLPYDDDDYDASTDPDYFNSNDPCDPNTEYCLRSPSESNACNGGDTICDRVMNQYECGRYARSARETSYGGVTFGLYRRSEIYWDPECEVDRDDIYQSRNPLDAALEAQLAVLVLSIICGVVAGIMFPIAMLTFWRSRNQEKEKLFIMDYVSPVFSILKIIPLVVSAIFVGRIYRLYAAAGTDECSDGLTNSTFDYLAEKLPEIYHKSIATAVMEFLMLLMGGYYFNKKVQAQYRNKHRVAPTAEMSKISPTSVQQVPQAPLQPQVHMHAAPQVIQGQPVQPMQQPMGQMGAPQPFVPNNGQPMYMQMPVNGAPYGTYPQQQMYPQGQIPQGQINQGQIFQGTVSNVPIIQAGTVVSKPR